jgi:hypothetical protein
MPAYNNSAAVPERDAIVTDWAARSAEVRREYAGSKIYLTFTGPDKEQGGVLEVPAFS